MKLINLCAQQTLGTKLLNGFSYGLQRAEQRACPFCFSMGAPLVSNNPDDGKKSLQWNALHKSENAAKLIHLVCHAKHGQILF
jgi:hypothetical protein